MVRSPQEQASFLQGLASSAVLFAHRKIHVWLQTSPPAHLNTRYGTSREVSAHHQRGLCVWELQLTALIKEPRRLLDVGALYAQERPPVFGDFARDVQVGDRISISWDLNLLGSQPPPHEVPS